jgi:hypothetical protein
VSTDGGPRFRSVTPPLPFITGVAHAFFLGSTSMWMARCWLQRWEARHDATLRPDERRPEEAGNGTEAGGAVAQSSSGVAPKPNERWH